ncbi:MAG: PRC-barrel domain-containing protein [Allosphingosinicella sp.]|uniref:PRC-barrel domain-containing protein n=1 Tax=Allosphingosinicella sp. TaxID=2823234 RepID=UPI003955BDAC
MTISDKTKDVEFTPEAGGAAFEPDPALEACGGDAAAGTDWRKVGLGVGAAAAVAGAAYAASRFVGRGDGEEDGEEAFRLRLQTDESMRLISSTKVEGTAVYGSDGARLGTIQNFMVDKYSGRVAYAVMTFGGHFGFGASLFPLPWAVLDYDEELDGYLLDVTKEELANAPRFEAADEPDFTPAYRRSILIFYRRPPRTDQA